MRGRALYREKNEGKLVELFTPLPFSKQRCTLLPRDLGQSFLNHSHLVTFIVRCPPRRYSYATSFPPKPGQPQDRLALPSPLEVRIRLIIRGDVRHFRSGKKLCDGRCK